MYNDQEEKYPIPSRATKGKHKSTKRLPMMFVIFVVLIGTFVGAKAYLGGQEQEAVEQQVLPSEEKVVESEQNMQSKLEENIEVEAANEEVEQMTEVQSEQAASNESVNPIIEPTQTEWQPIGTAQSEPHITTFEKESIDWQEMTKALQYATNLPEDEMIIWRLGNGGAPDLVVGTVSTTATKNTPTQVRLQWIENQGWMPIEVVTLDNNEYTTE